MATEKWIKTCLERRENGNKFTVTSDSGKEHKIGGLEDERRYFFGLCPSCYKIGEHSACSGRETTREKCFDLKSYSR